jgi:hypothetical protein
MATNLDVDARRVQRATALGAMARELRAWADVLPLWNPMSSGTWDGFLRARRSAEHGLKARLRSLPSCTLGVSANGWADLDLAGVRVRSDAGLQGVCAAWAYQADRLRLRRS